MVKKKAVREHAATLRHVGVDGYYKLAQNLIDDGQFGAAPILSAFNYARGQICGVELSQNYTSGGFSAYANLAVEEGLGEKINSAQSVLFDATDYNYIGNHYIYLDHSQSFTGSVGLSYRITPTETTPYRATRPCPAWRGRPRMPGCPKIPLSTS
jgi:hypothetical protein